VKKLIRAVLHRLGYDIVRYQVLSVSDAQVIVDLSAEEQKILATVSPFTMTSLERRAALINAINYLADARIPGDIAECGAWRGGSIMLVALTLLACRNMKDPVESALCGGIYRDTLPAVFWPHACDDLAARENRRPVRCALPWAHSRVLGNVGKDASPRRGLLLQNGRLGEAGLPGTGECTPLPWMGYRTRQPLPI
jgi:hypothetical protein